MANHVTLNSPSFQSFSQEKRSSFQKVADLAIIFFTSAKELILFPLRYVGSRSWSIPGAIIRFPAAIYQTIFQNSQKSFSEILFGTGYRNDYEETPDNERLRKEFLSRACIAAYAHVGDNFWVDEIGYQRLSPKAIFPLGLGEIEARDKTFFNPKTGFKASLVEKNNVVTVGFGGIGATGAELGYDSSEHAALQNRHVMETFQEGFGGIPPIFQEAARFFQAIKEHPQFQNKEIELTGPCLGGAIAQYLGLKFGHKTYCFNSLLLGAGLQWDLGKKKLENADKWITHLSIDRDFVSDNFYFSIPAKLLSLIGIRTAGNFGHRYKIPTAYKGTMDTHVYFLGSIMNRLGYGIRNKPHELPLLKAQLYIGI